MEYYVYVLKDDDKIFYVGKGQKRRTHEHHRLATKTNRKYPVLDKIRSMVSKCKKK